MGLISLIGPFDILFDILIIGARKMKIIYIHGYNSTGNSPKSAALKAQFGAENVVAPDFSVDPKEIEIIISNIVRGNTNFPVIFVGTSLGGFWANYFAQQWDAPCVLVNPSTKPSINLQKYNNPAITPEILKEYQVREQWLKENTNGKLIHLFVASNDDVISPKETLSNFPHTSRTVITKAGGHWYMDNWHNVVNKIGSILK
jgi:predicted esterase YcpF (UPF0227 family)